MLKRKLVLNLPNEQFIFLWDARQTGKSSYLKANFKHANYYDLLDTHEMLRFTKAFVISQDKRPRDLVINSDITLHILPWDIFFNPVVER